MTVKEIRERALTKLKGNWLMAMVGYVMTIFIPAVLAQLLFSFSETNFLGILYSLGTGEETLTWALLGTEIIVLLLLSLFILLLFGVLRTSYRWWNLDVLNDKDVSVKTVFQALHRNRIWKVVQLIVVRTVLIGLWSLLLVIPGIVKGYAYSQAINILKENPEGSVIDALRKSSEKMKGKKIQFFLLQLTYLPWYLVPVLLYIIFIWANWASVQVGFDMGPDGIAIVFGLALGILTIFGMLMLLFSFYVEPYKAMAKQIFYKELMNLRPSNSKQTDSSDFDEYERRVMGKKK